jgi:hypothetical protein
LNQQALGKATNENVEERFVLSRHARRRAFADVESERYVKHMY